MKAMLTKLPVRRKEDKWYVVFPSGHEVLVRIGGKPATFQPGWSAVFVFAGFAPLYILHLVRENGERSEWFLDDGMTFLIADNPDRLPSLYSMLLRRLATPVFNRFIQSAIREEKEGEPDHSGFLELSAKLRLALLRFCNADLFVNLPAIDLAKNHIDRILTPAATTSGFVELKREFLTAILESNLQQTYLDAISAGFLMWPSPIDGQPLQTTISFCIDDFRFAYRVIDRRFGLTFFIVCALHDCRVVGIYVPGLRSLYFHSKAKSSVFPSSRPISELPITDLISTFFSPSCEAVIGEHVCKQAANLKEYLHAPQRKLALFTRLTHLGHDLHNEFAGLNALLAAVPPATIPEVVLFRAGRGAELYGRTEDIFPELNGKTRRGIDDLDALARYTYKDSHCLLHVTRRTVQTSLRRRILKANFESQTLSEERRRLAQLTASGSPIVTVGLRVENRTLVDLSDFCCRLAHFLIGKLGRCALVIDGHSALNEELGTRVFASHRESEATISPIQIEREIADRLAKLYPDGRLEVISTIGAPIRRVLFWCHHSMLFVAIGGTGLAKYRWVCNTPGLIVTNRACINWPEMRIYEHPILEDATPVAFVPKEYVVDEPTAIPVVPYPGNPPDPNFFNFRIDDKGAFDLLSPMIESYWLKHRLAGT